MGLRAAKLDQKASTLVMEDSGMASVEEKVKSIIMDQLGVSESEVTPAASFVRLDPGGRAPLCLPRAPGSRNVFPVVAERSRRASG